MGRGYARLSLVLMSHLPFPVCVYAWPSHGTAACHLVDALSGVASLSLFFVVSVLSLSLYRRDVLKWNMVVDDGVVHCDGFGQMP